MLGELNPNHYDNDNANIWYERGNTFYELKRYEEGKDEDARKCFDQRKILDLDLQKAENFINLKRNKYGALIKCDGTLQDDVVNEWW